ncbi:Flagellar protein FliS [Planctomycetes bacterium Pan216]|uniref:Flagellar secretion chaperone FliS n=1 Tax=Kolteria novifilia TaxID=2527975 RepID=A0A518B299_9BACT|nr:Flagellar protein FliS [Planctomycetes bacterium Pan216]
MQHPASNAYLQNQIHTASSEELQLMLYDGAIRFARLARRALEENNHDAAQAWFERVGAIMCELHNGLRPDIAPELCANMAALYNFCHTRLITASAKMDLTLLDEAITVLGQIRGIWVSLMNKLADERLGVPSEPELEAVGTSFAMQM